MGKTIALACLCIFAINATALADTLGDCAQTRVAQLRMRACSEIIASSTASTEQKAFAYRTRGNARVDAGATAQALADLTQREKSRQVSPVEASSCRERA